MKNNERHTEGGIKRRGAYKGYYWGTAHAPWAVINRIIWFPGGFRSQQEPLPPGKITK